MKLHRPLLRENNGRFAVPCERLDAWRLASAGAMAVRFLGRCTVLPAAPVPDDIYDPCAMDLRRGHLLGKALVLQTFQGAPPWYGCSGIGAALGQGIAALSAKAHRGSYGDDSCRNSRYVRTLGGTCGSRWKGREPRDD